MRDLVTFEQIADAGRAAKAMGLDTSDAQPVERRGRPRRERWGELREALFMLWAEGEKWDAARIAVEKRRAERLDRARDKAGERFRKRWDALDAAMRSTGLMTDEEARIEAWIVLLRVDARARNAAKAKAPK